MKALKDATAHNGGVFERASDVLGSLQKELEQPEIKSAAPPSNAPLKSSDRPIPVEVHAPEPTPLDQLESIVGVALAPLATAGIVLVFVLFLLLQREDVRDRAIRLLGSRDLEKSTAAMVDAGDRLSRYFLTLTAINAGYGCFIGVVLWMIGVPSPFLWGILATLMRFVPFIGSFIAAICPLMLAAAVDSGWTMFLSTLALYVASEPIMGQVIEPVVQGKGTGLSPLAIVLSAAFWTLLWGPVGLLLSIPLTVVLVVLGSHVERLEFLHVLLGDTPPLTPAERFYQRMLAGDPAEASEQAEKMLRERSLADYYDEVMIPGLRLTQDNVDRGTLERGRLQEISDSAEDVIDALADGELVPKKRAEQKQEDSEEKNETDDARKESSFPEPVDRDLLVSEWRDQCAVLCLAGRTPLDDIAARAFEQLLLKCGVGAKAIAAKDAKRGALTADQLAGVQLICISALDVREHGAHTRFLTRRLRRSAPNAILLGGFWTLNFRDERDRKLAETIPVDKVAYSLRDALSSCLDAAKSGRTPIDRRQSQRDTLPISTSGNNVPFAPAAPH